jgi:hypothetical protein
MADKRYYGGIAWFLMQQKEKRKEGEKHMAVVNREVAV